MRRLILRGAAVAVVAACASAGAPPGGPVRHDPPRLVHITPDSGATNVRVKEADFQFDEVVSEKPSKGELDQIFLISPRDGAPHVAWHRSHISIRPRHGFKPNVAYTITMMAGITDIRGNISKESKQVLFSTGPAFPRFGIVGRVFDWVAERPAPGAVVEAIRLPDSTRYVATSDSLGGFDIGPFDEGTYVLRGYLDVNDNFDVDRTEKWDSITVHVAGTRPIAELLLIQRDSVPPRISDVTMVDTLTIRVTFDHAIVRTPAGFGAFTIVRADSTPLAIRTVLSPAQYDTVHQIEMRDTVKAPAAPVVPAAPPAAVPPAAPVRRDTTPPPPRPHIPPPPSAVVLLLSPTTPLVRGQAYHVTATGVQGVLGVVGKSTRQFVAPKAAPKDTTKAALKDTTKAAPKDTTRAPRPPLR